MARIAGVSVPTGKRLVIALSYIYGIGNTVAKKICAETGISENKKVKDLNDSELISIRSLIDEKYQVEMDLRQEEKRNIKRKVDIKCYEGLRHKNGLPVRGQRTHTNARTRKGKAVPIAGKKKVTK